MPSTKYGLFFISKKTSIAQPNIYVYAKASIFRGAGIYFGYELVPYTGSLNSDSAVTDIFELKSRIDNLQKQIIY